MKIIPKIKNLLSWLDNNILLLLGGFLLAFIPLYPKIPLFSPIEQYIVRVRVEDVLVFITGVVWLIQAIRKKINVNPLFFKLILTYCVISFFSLLSAIFLINTIPLEALHLGKSFLHFFRYIEYFSLFFILFSAIKNKKQIKIILAIFALTVVAVAVYGYGQRHYYWPVYSTMNREFSKGVRLYLTEHARVQSTFAGHYDLGAYLVITLPIILALALSVRKLWLKIALHLVHFAGLWLLVKSAARSSFLAYVVGLTIVTLFIALQKAKVLPKIKYFLSRYAFLGIMTTLTMFYFGDDMSERLLQVLQGYPQLNATYHQLNDQRKELFRGDFSSFLESVGLKMPEAQKPKGAISTEEAAILVSSDTRPSTERPSDVYEDIPDIVEVATISATGETEIIKVEKDRTYSDNALKYGLSLAIRLDTLWPQAIAGFQKNILLGSGYATLNKADAYTFTEADSTDNNFLRTLGETGLLGFITFYGIILFTMSLAFRAWRQNKDQILNVLAIGYMAGALGLLINALYIDVFAASKVAFSFWAVTGIFVGYYYLIEKEETSLIENFDLNGKSAKNKKNVASSTPKKKVKKLSKKSKKKVKGGKKKNT